jgi:cytochrome P450
MSQNPAIQERAQAVVDEAVKAEGGLPDFTQYQKLPYVDAIVREVLRWKPVAPVGAHFFLPPHYRASEYPSD